jgi:hypothetical protein
MYPAMFGNSILVNEMVGIPESVWIKLNTEAMDEVSD